jgi:hypothetical protein
MDREEALYLLGDVWEYLDDHSDVDVQGDPPQNVPNRAKVLADEVDELIDRLKRGQAI